MNRKMKLFISLSILLAVIFTSVYYCVNKFYIPDKEHAAVATQNTVNSKLNKNTKVSLFSKGKMEKEYSLDEIKNKLNIKDDLSKTDLVQLLDKEGYTFDSTINNELMFKKKKNIIKPGQYYIGEKDGYLAIYKSDDNGKLKIEDDSDVYKDFKTVDTLAKIDREKIDNFELGYDTKEKAEENLSEFLS